jgi:hypothetical protein
MPSGTRILDSYWSVTPPAHYSTALWALPIVLGQEFVLGFDSTVGPDLQTQFQNYRVEAPLEVASGTIWPRQEILFVRFTARSIRDLIEFGNRHAEPEVCIHLHGCSGGELVLQWFDFPDDPLLLRGDVPLDQVQAFAGALSSSYERYERKT